MPSPKQATGLLLGALLLLPSCADSPSTETTPQSISEALLLPIEPVDVFASSVEHRGLDARGAIDDDPHTRWSSKFSDPQWLVVDLGQPHEVSRVRLAWEVAASARYELQLSDTAAEGSWRSVFSTEKGDGNVDDIRGLHGAGRFLRIFSKARTTRWGVSLWDVNVFGSKLDAPASTCTALAEHKYERSKGRPQVFELAFAAMNPLGGPFTLRLNNGEQVPPARPWYCLFSSRPECRWDAHRVTSASVWLNGESLLVPRDFASAPPVLERKVTLKSSNVLKVELRGSPGFFTTAIGDADARAPRLEVLRPNDGAIVQSSPLVIQGKVDDPAALVTINGVAAPVSEQGTFEQTVALAEGDNTLLVIAADSCRNGSSRERKVRLDSVAPVTTAQARHVCSGVVQVSGNVQDATGPIALESEVGGARQPIALSAEGTFEVSVEVGDAASLSLIATDAANNAHRTELLLVPVVCQAKDACHIVGSCDPGTGQCDDPVASDGSQCSDHDACTLSDECRDGACVGSERVLCQPSDQCHDAGRCDELTGQCSNPSKPDGQACSDADACSVGDTCLSGVCSAGELVLCRPSDSCHVSGECDALTGQCSNPVAEDGLRCDDLDQCTRQDSCRSGICQGSDPVVCSAIDACHLPGTCSSQTGACSTPPRDCEDGDPCSYAGCDPVDGCVQIPDDGSECAEDPPPDDVTISDFALMGDRFHANQVVWVGTSLHAEAPHAEYRVELLLFPVVAELAPDAEVEGVHLGAFTIPVVASGTADYSFDVTLPGNIPAGEYELFVHEYPNGEFRSSLSHPEPYTVTADPGLPVLAITGLTVDQQAFLIDESNTVNPAQLSTPVPTPFGATVEVACRRHAASNVPITAYLEEVNGQAPVRLLIWDPREARYVSTLLLDAFEADDQSSVYLDLALSETDAQMLRGVVAPQVPSAAKVRIVLNEGKAVPEAKCDDSPSETAICNHAARPDATVFWPPPPAEQDSLVVVSSKPQQTHTLTAAAVAAAPGALTAAAVNTRPLISDRSYERYPQNSLVGVGLKVRSRASFTRPGFDATANALVRYKLLGNNGDFATFDLVSQAHWGEEAFYNYKVAVLGQQVADVTNKNFTINASLDVPVVVKNTPTYRITIMVWIIPVTISWGARGSFFIDGAIDLVASTAGADLSIHGGPVAALTGTVQASVGYSILGVGLQAGVRGDLHLTRADLTALVGGHLDVIPGANGSPELLRGNLRHSLTYDWSFLSGTISYFYEYPTLKFCKGFLGIPLPCGFKQKRNTKVWVSWPGVHLGPVALIERNEPQFELGLRCLLPSDCGGDSEPDPGPVCGNDVCDGVEDCVTCEGDCGKCEFVVEHFPVAAPNAFPEGITVGSDGNLWFTQARANRIGRISPWGDIVDFATGGAGAPRWIAAGSDGNLWFTGNNRIGRMRVGGQGAHFDLPTPFAGPDHIVAGPDGNLWFTETTTNGNGIGRITPSGVVTEFKIPTPNSLPGDITVGPDGA